MRWHQVVTVVTGPAGAASVSLGPEGAYSSYNAAFDEEFSETNIHQIFYMVQACVWLLLAVFGACLLLIAWTRRWDEARTEETAEPEPKSSEKRATARPKPATSNRKPKNRTPAEMGLGQRGQS